MAHIMIANVFLLNNFIILIRFLHYQSLICVEQSFIIDFLWLSNSLYTQVVK